MVLFLGVALMAGGLAGSLVSCPHPWPGIGVVRSISYWLWTGRMEVEEVWSKGCRLAGVASFCALL